MYQNQWVFKIKCNSMYWVHLVACGYSKVPSVNFSKNYFPEVNNINLCILLLMVIHFGYLAKKVNVEKAFLYEYLKDEIHAECPKGMSDVVKENCIILNECIYGLV